MIRPPGSSRRAPSAHHRLPFGEGRGPTLGILCLALAAAAVPCAAQEEAAGRFGETVDVEVVNVDVYVTGKDGQPVTGLTARDFEVREDGKKVDVAYFQAYEGAAPGGSLPEVPAAPSSAPAAPSAALHLAVVVDNINISPPNRNRVLGELRSFLQEKAADDVRVLFATFDGELNLRQGYTADPRAIETVLEELEGLPTRRFAREAERKSVLANLQVVLRELAAGRGNNDSTAMEAALSMMESTLAQVALFSESGYQDVAVTVRALEGLVSALGGTPGRKALLYLSDGIPMRPGEDLVFAVQDTLRDGRSLEPPREAGTPDSPQQGGGSGGGFVADTRDWQQKLAGEVSRLRSEIAKYDAGPLFERLGALANSNRVTFYTINGAGGDIAVLGADHGSDVGAVASPGGYLSIDQMSLRETIRQMAASTGGLSLAGGTDVEGLLTRIEDDFGRYYSLGYSPRHGGDGEVHRIKVKVKGRGLDVRYREGYVDRTKESRLGDRVMSALLLGTDDNQHGVEVEVVEQTPDEKDRYVVGVLVKIPIGGLVLVPREGYHEAVLELFVATCDADGGTSPVRKVPLSIKVPESQLDEARGQFYGAKLPLQMRSGEQRVAVGLWDATVGAGSFLGTPVHVGD